MADTGAPYFIPYVEPTDLVRDYPAADEASADAIAAALDAAGDSFDSIEVITATDATFAVPALGHPIVKVTVVGAGGGGGGGTNGGGVRSPSGSAGGTTTFDAGAAGAPAASGGAGGIGAGSLDVVTSFAGLASGNGGMGGNAQIQNTSHGPGLTGQGGVIAVAYLDLTGVATVDVTIGAGGAGGAGVGGAGTGRAGGAGSVLVEFKAA